MSINMSFKREVQWLSVIEDMEKVLTSCCNILKIDVSNDVSYPAINVIGSLDSGGIQVDKLRTPRRINITGDASGYANFDGSANIDINLTIADAKPKAHTHLTVDILDANYLNIANTIIRRDEFGDFSARIITANLVGNVIGNITGNITGNVSGDSANVTTNINGKAITTIFESNGTTIKLASSSAYATDSDTVDGKHASYFATSSHAHSGSDITSGTIPSERGVVSTSATASFLRYNGTTSVNGYLDGGTTAPTGTARLNYSGYFYATRVYNAIYNDYAECFIPEDGVNYNESKNRIVEINGSGKVNLASNKSIGVIGIVSDNYGILLGGSQEEIDNGIKIPIGLAGTLWVDCIEAVQPIHLHSFVCSGGEGKALAIDNSEIMKYNGCIVGKIIGIDIVKNQYKILISLK